MTQLLLLLVVALAASPALAGDNDGRTSDGPSETRTELRLPTLELPSPDRAVNSLGRLRLSPAADDRDFSETARRTRAGQ